jgi:hypothetical protein
MLLGMSRTYPILPLPESDIEADARVGIACEVVETGPEITHGFERDARFAPSSAAASAFVIARAMGAIAHASIRISQGR